MTPIEEASRRRRAIVAIIVVAVAIVAASIVAGIAIGSWQVAVLGIQACVIVPGAVVATRGRRRRLQRLLDAVRREVGEGGTASIVHVEPMTSAAWLGLRAFLSSYLVLVDDAEGLALWTVRSGRPMEVVRRAWVDVDAAVVGDDGPRVEVRPTDPHARTVIMAPVALDLPMSERMHSPSRMRALARRFTEHLHAARPELVVDGVRRRADVDWLRPPDDTRPSR